MMQWKTLVGGDERKLRKYLELHKGFENSYQKVAEGLNKMASGQPATKHGVNEQIS